MRILCLMICVVVLCLAISVGFAACKPTTGGNDTTSESSVIANNSDGAQSTDSTVSQIQTSSIDEVSSVVGNSSSETVSINMGDNVFVDDWD